MGALSLNFDLEAFACHTGEPVPPDKIANVTSLVVYVLQLIRDEWAGPIIVVSGYRSPAYNKRVGGAVTSTHLLPRSYAGADIRPVHIADVPKLHTLILAMHARGVLPELGGLGEYAQWCHVDNRKIPGRLRRWKGHGIGSEPIG